MALGGVAVALGMTACGGSSGDSGDSQASLDKGLEGSSQSAACKAQPAKGGTLVYARQQLTENLNTLELVNGNGDIFASNQLFNGLTRPDPKGSATVQPAVAEKWEVSDDGKTYTFHIREGIKFSDGSPVTAEDVKFSLDRFGDPKINQTLAAVAVGYGSQRGRRRLDREGQPPVPGRRVPVQHQHLPRRSSSPRTRSRRRARRSGRTRSAPARSSSRSSSAARTSPSSATPTTGRPASRTSTRSASTSRPTPTAGCCRCSDGQAQIADGVPFSQVNDLKGDKDLTLQTAKVPLFVGAVVQPQAQAARRPPGAPGACSTRSTGGDQQGDLPRRRHDPRTAS